MWRKYDKYVNMYTMNLNDTKYNHIQLGHNTVTVTVTVTLRCTFVHLLQCNKTTKHTGQTKNLQSLEDALAG